jgi:hypothetical protein
MKKSIFVLILICLTLGGNSCSILQKAGSLLCNPTDSQKAEAKQGEAFAAAALALVKDAALQAKLAAAEDVFNMVAAAVCVAAKDLTDAINTVDAAGASITPTQVMAAAPGVPAVPNLTDLRKWVQK